MQIHWYCSSLADKNVILLIVILYLISKVETPGVSKKRLKCFAFDEKIR
jgi:hypothetical protein